MDRAEIVITALNSFYLWDHCKLMKLTKTICLLLTNLSACVAKDIKEFIEWILNFGGGKIAELNYGEAMINIQKSFLLLRQMIILK